MSFASETKLVSVASKRLFENIVVSYQEYERIRRSCVERGHLFKDPVFRASDKSLAWEDAQNHTESIGFKMKKDQVVWLRPHVGLLNCIFFSSERCKSLKKKHFSKYYSNF